MKPLGARMADVDPEANATVGLANPNGRLGGRREPVGKSNPFLPEKAKGQRSREQVSHRLGWMVRRTQIEGLINAPIRVGKGDLEMVQSRAEGHRSLRRFVQLA